jgi:alkylated DNA repair dioxygenase AlkB
MQIPNLTYLPNFISEKEENELVEIIDAQPWLDDLKRRVQHYGYKYDYKARRIDTSMKIGILPDWLENIGKNLQNQGFFKQKPDQVIVNEYFAGQGIAAHIDCEPCFEDTIISLSLLAPVYMDFTKEDEKIPLWLESRSAVVLQGESRYEWKHSIAARKSDIHNGLKINRERRVSLTFRKVIL